MKMALVKKKVHIAEESPTIVLDCDIFSAWDGGIRAVTHSDVELQRVS